MRSLYDVLRSLDEKTAKTTMSMKTTTSTEDEDEDEDEDDDEDEEVETWQVRQGTDSAKARATLDFQS